VAPMLPEQVSARGDPAPVFHEKAAKERQSLFVGLNCCHDQLRRNRPTSEAFMSVR
jgi:hypothetical protein